MPVPETCTIVTGSSDVLIGDSPKLVDPDKIQRLNIQFPAEKSGKKSSKPSAQTKPQKQASNSGQSSSNNSSIQSSSSTNSGTAGPTNPSNSAQSQPTLLDNEPPEEVTIWLAAPGTKEASNWSDGYIQSILEIADEIDAETEITAGESDIEIVEYSGELSEMFQPMFKPAEDRDKAPAKVTISLIDGITPNGVKPFSESDLIEAAVTFEQMAPLIDGAINGDPMAIAELSPAVVTRKPISEEQLASLNEERPTPVAPTPIERLNIEFPNGRNSKGKAFTNTPQLTAAQSAQVDEIHASLLSSNIKGITKPEVAEYVTKRESLVKQAAILENGTWYRGKAHDVADKNREVALLDYEFARRSDQVGLKTVTPILNLLGTGAVVKAGVSSVVGRKGVSTSNTANIIPEGVATNSKAFGRQLNEAVRLDAKHLINTSSKNQLKKLAATSRAGISKMGIKSGKFENLQARIPEFPGLHVDGKNFTIVDKDAFMSEVRIKFGQSNNPLNPMTEKLILNHINSKSSFPTTAGIPGLHAEVQAANDVFNQVARKGIDLSTFDVSKVQVSTFKLAPDKTGGQGLAFDACSNCGNILAPPINILTGRKF